MSQVNGVAQIVSVFSELTNSCNAVCQRRQCADREYLLNFTGSRNI